MCLCYYPATLGRCRAGKPQKHSCHSSQLHPSEEERERGKRGERNWCDRLVHRGIRAEFILPCLFHPSFPCSLPLFMASSPSFSICCATSTSQTVLLAPQQIPKHCKLIGDCVCVLYFTVHGCSIVRWRQAFRSQAKSIIIMRTNHLSYTFPVVS